MIYRADINLKKKLFSMFENMNDTMILSCLQGYMGDAWVDDSKEPTVAQIIVGDFVFYAGNPNSKIVEELLYNIPEHSLIIVKTKEWKEKIEETHKGYIEKFKRYAFKKNPEHLDYNHIKKFLLELPYGYELKKIDESLAKEPSLQKLSEDFTGQFDSIEDYLNRGLGFCILHNGQVVCGASSYSIYDNGIEIEIDTDYKYRRKGLATIVASALILECLNRRIYPSWDAANTSSLNLAEKLGYVLEEAYDTYYVHYKK
ncbi:GNAT family N-acetyltransferase [Clostridium hydrogeniformans]|uniref:GNAT family N-acetyltransferase n=1 Tax=Clostridium hydrogeniformans TaxID=349933 RepID=UPI000485A924|nr:GNAT family N-acetyltransferase [Clostridium hydrogeniformans]